MRINAHGKTYESEKAVHVRLGELRDQNVYWGESDGRVTEQNALREALREAQDAEAAANYRQWAGEQVRKAQFELSMLKAYDRRNVPADHRIEYEDGNRRLVSRYTTEDGFLKALIRLYSGYTRYNVLFVD